MLRGVDVCKTDRLCTGLHILQRVPIRLPIYGTGLDPTVGEEETAVKLRFMVVAF